MKERNARELVKPQKIQQVGLVEAYCASAYVAGSTNNTTKCGSGYSCGWWSVSSQTEEDDVLF
ncbi:MAG TPA: hypothetical protein PKA00_05290 [Saprospiraceae bacterium]|nr:hypothetical protein [Saprospiraceae bacterium]HMQ82296.1 hypothetical protein [Saprospiraceae bacterium]